MIGFKEDKQPEKSIRTMMTISDVARIFNVHTSTIRRWSEQGMIKSYSVGPRGALRFLREDVAVAYLDRAIQRYLKDISA